MEIERKYLIDKIPDNIAQYPCRHIEQGYLCTDPVVRVRRADDEYTLTYKGSGLMVREEYNLPLTAEAYEHLKAKADGRIIAKDRYLIPLDGSHAIELDVFSDGISWNTTGSAMPLVLAEVEFESEDEANSFVPPDWFGEDVTFSTKYHNSTLSQS